MHCVWRERFRQTILSLVQKSQSCQYNNVSNKTRTHSHVISILFYLVIRNNCSTPCTKLNAENVILIWILWCHHLLEHNVIYYVLSFCTYGSNWSEIRCGVRHLFVQNHEDGRKQCEISRMFRMPTSCIKSIKEQIWKTWRLCVENRPQKGKKDCLKLRDKTQHSRVVNLNRHRSLCD